MGARTHDLRFTGGRQEQRATPQGGNAGPKGLTSLAYVTNCTLQRRHTADDVEDSGCTHTCTVAVESSFIYGIRPRHLEICDPIWTRSIMLGASRSPTKAIAVTQAPRTAAGLPRQSGTRRGPARAAAEW